MESTSSRRRRNVVKDLSKPKKPRTAYIFYCNSTRQNVVAKNPTLKPTEVIKHMSQTWNALSEKEKAPFQKMAKVDTERHKTEMVSYVPPPVTESTTGGRRRRAVRDPNAPKKPMNAYMFYASRNRKAVASSHPDAKFAEVTQLIGESWRGMSDKEKVPYVRLATEDRARYERAKRGDPASLVVEEEHVVQVQAPSRKSKVAAPQVEAPVQVTVEATLKRVRKPKA